MTDALKNPELSDHGHFWSMLSVAEHFSSYNILFYFGIFAASWLLYKATIEPFLSPLRKIPGLPYNPLLGNMKLLMTGEAMETSIKMVETYGPFVRYYFMFGRERLLIADPDAMKHILVTNSRNYIKPPERFSFLVALLGNGLVTSEGATHAMHKRLMSPAFNNHSISKMIPIFERRINNLVEFWKKSIEKDPVVNIHSDLTRTTLDIIGQTAFGYDFHSLENPNNKVGKAFYEMLTGFSLSYRVLIPFYQHLPFPAVRRFKENLNLVKSVVNDIIDAKRKQLKIGREVELVTKDVLGMMMVARDEETGQGMTDQELQDQVVTLMSAGHETTAVAMSWCLLMLATHPEIQEKARTEVSSLLSNDMTLTFDNIEKLEYCGWVVKETLRYLPPVPFTLRKALSPDVLGGKYSIPTGTILFLCMGPMMRRPEIFENPDKFLPERFQDRETEASLYKFLPFLIGPRMCLGYKFALVEMKVMLVQFLRHLRFDIVPGTRYKRKSTVTMRPEPSLQLRVSLVNKETL